MKKIIFIILIFLSGCTLLSADGSMVEKPKIKVAPIYGEWKIVKCILNDQMEDKFLYKDLIGKTAIFSNNEILVDNIYVKNPQFKVKKIRAGKYLYKKYNVSPSNLNINSDILTSIYIADKSEFYYEILKQSDKSAFIFLNGYILEIQKIEKEFDEDKLSEHIAELKKAIDSDFGRERLNDIHSGVLLGIKSKADSNVLNYNYKSVYIKFKNNRVENVYELPNLIVPKDVNFAEIEVQRKSKKDVISDNVVVRDKKNMGRNSDLSEDKDKNNTESIIKNIIYLSPDYINIENINLKTGEKKLRLYFFDSYNFKNPLDIYHFTDNKYNEFDSYDNLEMIKKDIKNIGLYRDNGFWKLKGRLNYEQSDKYKDFDLNLLLPGDINKYNKLSVPMSELRRIHSNIRDAFIDPFNKILITLENDKIKIYNIDENKNISMPIYEKEISENSDVIMSEWALGSYAQKWQKEISRKK